MIARSRVVRIWCRSNTLIRMAPEKIPSSGNVNRPPAFLNPRRCLIPVRDAPMAPAELDALVRTTRWTALTSYVNTEDTIEFEQRLPLAAPFHGAIQDDCAGIHAAKHGTGFEAMKPIRQGVRAGGVRATGWLETLERLCFRICTMNPTNSSDECVPNRAIR